MVQTITQHLHRTGLKRKNLEERIIVGVGFWPGELLPPYNFRVTEKDAIRILKYLKQKENEGNIVRRFEKAVDHESVKMFGNYLIEVVGCFAQQCVYDTINAFLEADYYVLLNTKQIISSDYGATRLGIRESLHSRLLWRQENRRFRQLEEDLLSYTHWRSLAKLEGRL